MCSRTLYANFLTIGRRPADPYRSYTRDESPGTFCIPDVTRTLGIDVAQSLSAPFLGAMRPNSGTIHLWDDPVIRLHRACARGSRRQCNRHMPTPTASARRVRKSDAKKKTPGHGRFFSLHHHAPQHFATVHRAATVDDGSERVAAPRRSAPRALQQDSNGMTAPASAAAVLAPQMNTSADTGCG